MANGKILFMNQVPRLCGGKENKYKIENKTVLENRLGLIEKYFLANDINDEVTVTDGYNGESAKGIILTTRYVDDETIRVQVMNPSRFESRKVFLKVMGDKAIEGRKVMYDGKNTLSEISLEPTESIKLVIKNANKHSINESQDLKTKVLSKPIYFDNVKLLETNALTIDKCNVYVNGNKILEDVLPAACADDVYEYAYKTGKEAKVRLEYIFNVEGDKASEEIVYVVAEDDGLTAVEVNGVSVSEKKEGWWIDKSFGKFAIEGLAKAGENVVALEFDIKKHEESDEGEDFEGYRNKFFYSIEPENVYILGNFDVSARGETYEDVEALYKSGPFAITERTEKEYKELTSQGLWFYCGNVSYKGSFLINDVIDRKGYIISLPEMNEVAAKVMINGQEAGTVFRAPYKLNVSDFIVEGNNEIEIILYGNNRNLLGPHHHKMGNPHMLGVPTFLGKKCFTDFIYPELTEDDVSRDDYAFRKFGLKQVVLEEYK